jgi:hypothetical protein
MRRIRLTTTLVAIPLAVAACGAATSSSSSTSHQVTVRHAPGAGVTARSYGDRLLAAVHVPAGAQPATEAPAQVLDSPPQTPSFAETPVVAKRFWTVGDSAQATSTWLRQHRPAGRLDSAGSSTATRPTRSQTWFMGYRAANLPGSLAAGYLYLAVVATGPHTSAIGAYAVTLRQPQRPADERVPLQGTRVVIHWALAVGGTPALKTLAGSAASRLVRDFDALRVDAGGTVMCPMIPSRQADITVDFTNSRRVWQATIPSCPAIKVTTKTGGSSTSLPPLAFGNPFLNDVKGYTGYLPQSGPVRHSGGVIPLVVPRSH